LTSYRAYVGREAYRLYLSDHLLRDVIPIWNHYSTDRMLITRDLLEAELSLAGVDPQLSTRIGFRWVHSVLTPPGGIELRIIEWPGVLGWGFI
jgi:hypothetical protein